MKSLLALTLVVTFPAAAQLRYDVRYCHWQHPYPLDTIVKDESYVLSPDTLKVTEHWHYEQELDMTGDYIFSIHGGDMLIRDRIDCKQCEKMDPKNELNRPAPRAVFTAEEKN